MTQNMCKSNPRQSNGLFFKGLSQSHDLSCFSLTEDINAGGKTHKHESTELKEETQHVLTSMGYEHIRQSLNAKDLHPNIKINSNIQFFC